MKHLVAQRVPHARQLEDESGDGSFALDEGGVCNAFHAAIRPVDLDGLGFGVNQPTQLRAIGHVLLQLALERLQTVGIGAKLDDEVRAEVHEALAVFRSEAAGQQPAGIGRAPGAIGQDEAGGRIEGDSPAVLVRPNAQSYGDTRISRGSEGVGRGHDDNFAFGGHFEREIGVIGAERGEVVVRHGSGGKGRWQLAVLDQEWHGFSLSQWDDHSARGTEAEGQHSFVNLHQPQREQYGGHLPISVSSDDIKFVTLRRTS